nr:glutathione peroxidase-like protein [Arenicola marina]
MDRHIFLTVSFILLSLLSFTAHASKDLYSYFVDDAKGNRVSLEQYRGKVTLVTNVASECGFTEKHYKGLVQLKKILGDERFEVLAFPCNQFGSQEPGNIDDIIQWAKKKFDVNFPIFSKINVVNDDVPEAWEYLRDETGHGPTWNFWKYLVDHNGVVQRYWGPWSDVEEVTLYFKAAVDDAIKAAEPGMPAVGPGRPAPVNDPTMGSERPASRDDPALGPRRPAPMADRRNTDGEARPAPPRREPRPPAGDRVAASPAPPSIPPKPRQPHDDL